MAIGPDVSLAAGGTELSTGAGNITLLGGSLDLVIDGESWQFDADTRLIARRDVLLLGGSSVTMTNGASLWIQADYVDNSTGGVWVATGPGIDAAHGMHVYIQGASIHTNNLGHAILIEAPVVAAGNLLLEGTASSVSVGCSLVAGTNASVVAFGDILQGADITAGSGDLFVESGGSIVMDAATVSTAGGNIRYRAEDNVALGHLNATGVVSRVSVLAQTGDITDANADDDANITADAARLWAGGSIGSGGGTTNDANAQAVALAVNRMEAYAGTDVYLQSDRAVEVGNVGDITTSYARFDSGVSSTIDDDLDGIEGDTGVAKLKSTGAITVSETYQAGTDALLLAEAGSITVSNTVTAGTHATVIASSDITQSAGITATSGDLYVESRGGSITMDADTVSTTVSTAGGNIRYRAQDDVSLGHLNATGVVSQVSVLAQTGDITDANADEDANITADAARLWAGGSIGSGGGTTNDVNAQAVDLAVNQVEAYAGTNVYLQSDRTVEVGNVGAITTSYARFDSGASSETDEDLDGIEGEAGAWPSS